MAEKEEEYNNIDIVEAVRKLQKHKTEILEHFSKAYLAETGLMPSEVELTCKEERDGTIITTTYAFRRKSE